MENTHHARVANRDHPRSIWTPGDLRRGKVSIHSALLEEAGIHGHSVVSLEWRKLLAQCVLARIRGCIGGGNRGRRVSCKNVSVISNKMYAMKFTYKFGQKYQLLLVHSCADHSERLTPSSSALLSSSVCRADRYLLQVFADPRRNSGSAGLPYTV